MTWRRPNSVAQRLALAGALFAGAIAPAARAQDDGQLRLMREPFTFVDVADAFDDEDPIDINVHVGFLRTWQYGELQRERTCLAGGVDQYGGMCSPTWDPHRYARNWANVAHHEQSTNILNLGLDVGIFRDLMIYGRMPLILSDDRSLGNVDTRYLTADSGGNGYPPLFTPGADGAFRSPTRGGLDYITAGLAWSIMNQHRERELPTWVLMIEGRLNVGDPMRACQATASGPQCIAETTNSMTGLPDVDRTAGRNAGSNSGTNALRIETRASWRTRYVEPYGGLSFQIAWPGQSDRFFLPANNIQGFINDRPPILGALTGGLAIIPWENRGAWQRFAIDVRFMGTYVSEGHGYSPLYDALGTSSNPYLDEPVLEGQPDGTTDLRQANFYGLTDMQSHAEIAGMLGVEMQAARYVKFGLGFAVWYVSPYMITFADACNPNVSAPAGDPRIGTCRTGIINPHHRSAIDLPGQRFRMAEQVRLDLFINAQAMF
ncbi:MAG: hypothetical protein K8H88_18120 [Sandaracinaceae bacterium]|nr:hypothetical protein [Sandaracinaceae bacterium]